MRIVEKALGAATLARPQRLACFSTSKLFHAYFL